MASVWDEVPYFAEVALLAAIPSLHSENCLDGEGHIVVHTEDMLHVLVEDMHCAGEIAQDGAATPAGEVRAKPAGQQRPSSGESLLVGAAVHGLARKLRTRWPASPSRCGERPVTASSPSAVSNGALPNSPMNLCQGIGEAAGVGSGLRGPADGLGAIQSISALDFDMLVPTAASLWHKWLW